MTKIKPFKGIRYNLDKIIDLSTVVCPPYDVINKEEQDFYYRQNPYNFIRLILNKEESGDDSFSNKYKRSAEFFNEWLKTEILKEDNEEAIYFYKQDYFCESKNKELSRLGIIALLEINDDGIVFPHENTFLAAKTDRFELVKSVKANLSPIFTIFSDKDKIIKKIFDKELSQKRPDLLLKDIGGVRNSVWRLTDSKKILEITDNMRDKQIFIADGHHRYEVAVAYLNLMQKEDKDYSRDKNYNFIMTYFTPSESDGLYIMPVHRVIKSEINFDSLEKAFKISKLNSLIDLEDKLDLYSKKHVFFGLYYHKDALLLELKNRKEVNNYFIKNKCFINLDVATLDFYILTELLKIKKDDIIYTKEIKEIKELVDNNKAVGAFILRSVNVKQIKDVALCGEKMPPKSSYFFPKLLSGLVIHKFSEDIRHRTLADKSELTQH